MRLRLPAGDAANDAKLGLLLPADPGSDAQVSTTWHGKLVLLPDLAQVVVAALDQLLV